MRTKGQKVFSLPPDDVKHEDSTDGDENLETSRSLRSTANCTDQKVNYVLTK